METGQGHARHRERERAAKTMQIKATRLKNEGFRFFGKKG